MSTKGQVVLPQAIRAVRRWKPGTEFIVEEDDGGVRLKPAVSATSPTWESLIGCVGYRGPRKSLRQINAALAAAARRYK
jgi:AbrB family looped-hinge helix DNA binding protein